MASIHTLIPDIHALLAREKQAGAGLADAAFAALSEDAAATWKRLTDDEIQPEQHIVRASQVGTPCARRLWYTYHTPDMAEQLTGKERLKFLYGDTIEGLLLALAVMAGHDVTMQQYRIEKKFGPWTVRGHIDAVIDGHLTDVKSASAFSFTKFVDGLTEENDAFGYITQLNVYRDGLGIGLLEPTFFLAMNKESAELALSPCPPRDVTPLIETRLEMLEKPVDGVSRIHGTEEANGNVKLSTQCRYCPFKVHCWSAEQGGPGLKAYQYAKGPAYFSHVVSVPKVPEIDLHQVPGNPES